MQTQDSVYRVLTIVILLVLLLGSAPATAALPSHHRIAAHPILEESTQIFPIAEASADGYWTQRASMTTARDHPGVVGLNGKVYVFGGSNASGALESMEIYDPATDTWMPGPPMPGTKSRPNAVETGGLIGRIQNLGEENKSATNFTN